MGFAGTPAFAAQQLQALLDHQESLGLEVSCVLTQPDRAAGRGLSMTPSLVKQIAQNRGAPIYTPAGLKAGHPDAASTHRALQGHRLDVLIVVAYGLILPASILTLPRWGCINLHASLLPRWRGAAPIQRALASGDTQTGVCVMQMADGLDTGPIWSTHELVIDPLDTFQVLHDRLAALASEALLAWLEWRPFLTRQPTAQPEVGVCYAAKITAEDRPIRFERPADDVCNQVRALDPSPGATASWQGVALKCGGAGVVEELGRWAPSGTIVRLPSRSQPFIAVACGRGVVGLSWFQRPGGKRQSAEVFARGAGWAVGSSFDSGSDA